MEGWMASSPQIHWIDNARMDLSKPQIYWMTRWKDEIMESRPDWMDGWMDGQLPGLRLENMLMMEGWMTV